MTHDVDVNKIQLAVREGIELTRYLHLKEHLKGFFFDKQGNEIHVYTFEKLSLDKKYKVLKKELLSNGAEISSVWLGMPTVPIRRTGKPILFETMIFSENPRLDEYQERYYTEEEAIKRHKEIVQIFKKRRLRRYIEITHNLYFMH